ncbi:MAG TPA: sulfotransferase [Actinomycetota bacterium]|nr:sulfotransferase [Actinomycetota bacterium]
MASAPILVTGSHRSGTTWAGRMLSLSPRVGYVHEPFNVQRWPGWTRRPLPWWYLYVCEENEREYIPLVEDVLRFRYPIPNLTAAREVKAVARMALDWPFSLLYRAGGFRPLVKDPIALMSAEWLAKRFGMDVVAMIRHPAGFAGSLKRLDWRFEFHNWRDQPLLLRDLIGPFEAQVREYAEREHDLIDQAILMWNVTHHVILGYRERHPEWSFVRHEDLAEEPLKGFRSLYDRLDLEWDWVAEDAVVRHSTDQTRAEVPTYLHQTVRRDSRAARWTWRNRLTPEEQRRVREGTAEVAASFYSDEDWEPR